MGPAIGKAGAYIQVKRIEAARDIADSLSKSRNRAYLDSDSLLLNLTASFDSNLERIPDAQVRSNYEQAALERNMPDQIKQEKSIL